jgi:hypothetical protein
VNHAASATVRRFPSIVGALIIAASILLSALMFAAGTRFTAVETSNEDVAWLVDRIGCGDRPPNIAAKMGERSQRQKSGK